MNQQNKFAVCITDLTLISKRTSGSQEQTSKMADILKKKIETMHPNDTLVIYQTSQWEK